MVLFASATVYAADTLTIVHVNDSHSFLSSGGQRNNKLEGSIGGMARAATMILDIRQKEKNVLCLHAGDFFIGDLFFQRSFGIAEIQLLQSLGFNAITLGNHEFDLTPSVLQMSFDTAFAGGQSMQVLSANAIIPKDSFPRLHDLVQPYTICDVNGIKVGVFGMTTPLTNTISLPAPVFLDTNIVEIATAMVASLKAQGCSSVIFLSHLGLSLDRVIATYVDGIDLIVGGHDHFLLAKPVMVQNAQSSHRTPIVQASSFYHNIGKVQLVINNDKQVEVLDAEVLPVRETTQEHPQVKAVVDALMADIEATYGKMFSEQIAIADDDCAEMVTDALEPGSHDTPVGNLVSDAYRAFGKTDIGIQPGGSTAEQLYKGPLVADDIFRVSGYGFNLTNGLGYRMVNCTLSGAEIAGGLEFGLADIENSDDFMLQCSGLNYRYNSLAAPFQRLLSVNVHGAALDPQKDYTLCVNEFVVAFLQFLNIQPRDVYMFGDTTEFQVLAAYCMALNHVNAHQEGRIIADKIDNVENSSPALVKNLLCAPNPADSFTRITFDAPPGADVRVEIFDSRLRHLRSQQLTNSTSAEQGWQLSTSDLSSGTYYLRWTINGQSSFSILHVVH